MSDAGGPKPPPPQYQSPPQFQPPPGTYQPPQGPMPYYPPGSPGYMPPPIHPAAGIGIGMAGLSYQFGGRAAWSVGFGLISTVVPFLVNGIYFRVFPIVGVIYGIQAIRQGRPIGGIVGIVLCVLGGVVSLFASGLLH